MKKLFSFFLSACLLIGLTGCGGAAPVQTTSTPSEPVETTTETTPTRVTGKEALDGKKIIFIGNSYTMYGYTVMFKSSDYLSQEDRSYDHGYFYQLCKANGLEVSVTNWTFGSHELTDIFGNPCTREGTNCSGQYHEYYLTEPYFDYVCIQPFVEKSYAGNIVSHLKYTMDFFRKANPNVQFLLLVPHMAAERNYVWFKEISKLHEQEGVTIVNWGGMLHDICEGKTAVPGATLTIDRSSFVCSKDNHHENVLAGYLTTLMVYCAITGESAVGQPYDFCNDNTLDPLFDLEAFRSKYYPDGGVTNFPEIFASKEDMNGLQQLADQYLLDFNGGN